MYTSYWQLDRKPFESGADTTAYYPSQSHQASLLKLRYSIENRSGGALLAGPSGIGKTLLVRLLAERLGEAFRPVVHVFYPAMSSAELLAYLAVQLGDRSTAQASMTLDESVATIGRALEQNVAAGRHALVVVDEAQSLAGRQALETLRLLMNFNVAGQPALSLLLVGQPALLPMVDRVPELEERLSVKCLMRPFTVEETMSYVQHRLALAGAKHAIFSTGALETVHQLSEGLPRRINRLCDLALLIGYANEQKSIDAGLIEALAGELAGVAPE
ncbi:MAG: AAA family ATPase [Planctomycetes bacterium]|nr:AAA family ATPase [Planctomycetota bacterium]